jgi:heterodisulfide reductase subunit A
LFKKSDVVIIGGGISGITSALELKELGFKSTIIEKEASIGGLSASFCCKASESCNKCFSCVVDKKIFEINTNKINIFTNTKPIALNGSPGQYMLTIKRGKEKLQIECSAIVIASGIEPYDATKKVEYGYGRFKNVITAKDLDEMLRKKGTIIRPSDGKIPQNVAFFQCVGSRDESIGNLYCSQVCCAYALRLIKSLRHNYPQIMFTFLYMDIQPAGISFKKFLNSCQADKGIRFIRSLPSKVYYSPKNENLRVRFINPDIEDVVEEIFDMIILSVGISPGKESNQISQIFGLSFSEDGFLKEPPYEKGIFLAGACKGPKDIERSIIDAKSTAFKVQNFLRGLN